MNFSQMEYFLTLTDTLNYTTAAEKLNISQPKLSRIIFDLERTAGAQLFIRSKRDVRLTSSGKTFYPEIKKTYESYKNLLKISQEIEQGMAGVVNLGFSGTAFIHIMPKILNKFSASYPKIIINPIDFTFLSLMEAMKNKEIDMGVLPDLETDEIPDIDKKTIYADDMCVVVNQSHLLASRDSIKLIEIKDESFIHIDPKSSIQNFKLINNICKTENFVPNTIYEASSQLNMLMLADCRKGVTILPRHMQSFASNTVRFVKIEGFEKYYHIACVWQKHVNQCVPKLLDTIDTYFRAN